MVNPIPTAADIRALEYAQRLEVNRLRREVFGQADPTAATGLAEELIAAERELTRRTEDRAALDRDDPRRSGVVVDTRGSQLLMGPETTGLEVQVHVRMAQVPTSIYHLLDAEESPLVSSTIRNVSGDPKSIKRMRVSSHVEGYSATAIETAEIKASAPIEHEFRQLPTFFPNKLRRVTELTRATLNVLIEDLDGKTELQRTRPIWLLARTTAATAVIDPKSGLLKDMTPYLGAYVTPNSRRVMAFLRQVTEHHPEKHLGGYQPTRSAVEPQIRAMFEALRASAGIRYVNSVIDFSPEDGSTGQRVRLPHESLRDRAANCLDGTVLFASLIEAISMSPALVIVPGHAIVGWETWGGTGQWDFLETTMIGGAYTFEQARASARATATRYREEAVESGDPSRFRLWPLRDLRAQRGITPME